MGKRRIKQRFPAGEHVESLEFWPGKAILSIQQNQHIANQMQTVNALRNLLWSVDLGTVQVRDVPMSISADVRTALEGLRILNGTEVLTEKL